MARVAAVVNGVRTAEGDGNVLLVDAGDEMQGSLLSNLQKGEPTIAAYNAMGYAVATFGNHEFDWGQTNLIDRVSPGRFPLRLGQYRRGRLQSPQTGLSPSFVQPYVVKTIGTAPNAVSVAFIGVTTTETPSITVASATAGLCFKDAGRIRSCTITMK